MTLERAARYSFIVLVACAFALACGGDEPPKPTPATTPKPVAKSKQPKMPEPSANEQLKGQVALPDYYPKDAPTYAGARPTKVGWESGRVSAVFTTDDDLATVSRGVQSNLESNGWEDIVEAEMVNGVVVQAGKDRRGVSALISRMEEDTSDEVTMILVAVDP